MRQPVASSGFLIWAGERRNWQVVGPRRRVSEGADANTNLAWRPPPRPIQPGLRQAGPPLARRAAGYVPVGPGISWGDPVTRTDALGTSAQRILVIPVIHFQAPLESLRQQRARTADRLQGSSRKREENGSRGRAGGTTLG
jgi:hypothetical protein